MASDKSVCDEITSRLTPMGPVTGRRMFGGFGVFMDGLMFGLIADGILYLKVDDGNRQPFEKAGSPPFSYQRKSRPVQMSYWRVPANIFEDGYKLVDWASEALSAAKRAKIK